MKREERTSSVYGWYSRGYIPHFDSGEFTQFITFRLADSMPKQILDQWSNDLKGIPIEEASEQMCRRIEAYLDKGRGDTWLIVSEIAELVEKALLYFDGERYYIHAWVIMPNHVHSLLTPSTGWNLSTILQSWKSYTAKKANSILKREGRFWQREYFDRYIRNHRHYMAAINYIEENPLKAGLCHSREDWSYSSAAKRLLYKKDQLFE
jgi:REP element-mobilizing transposase RayT